LVCVCAGGLAGVCLGVCGRVAGVWVLARVWCWEAGRWVGERVCGWVLVGEGVRVCVSVLVHVAARGFVRGWSGGWVCG
jgi:hypothetical protein